MSKKIKAILKKKQNHNQIYCISSKQMKECFDRLEDCSHIRCRQRIPRRKKPDIILPNKSKPNGEK